MPCPICGCADSFSFVYIFNVTTRRQILEQYEDLNVWLATIGSKDLLKLTEIKNEAIQETAKHFHISAREVNGLIRGTQPQYSDSDTPIVIFFHEYLRKTQESHL